MSNLVALTSKINKLKLKALQYTGKEPQEVHISYEDFAELEDCLGIEVYTIGGMIVVPNRTVQPGSCRIEVF